MDVETVSQSSAAGTEDVDMVNIQPEVAAGESAGGGSRPPPPPAAGGASGEAVANPVVAGDASAPEEKAEPSVPEVAVPLPPNFGETNVHQTCTYHGGCGGGRSTAKEEGRNVKWRQRASAELQLDARDVEIFVRVFALESVRDLLHTTIIRPVDRLASLS